MHISPIFFHGNPGEGMEKRFDTTMMPNGSIAVLNNLAQGLGYESVAVDEGYLGQDATALDVLTKLIEGRLSSGIQPVILASVLSYNASTTLPLLEALKQRYGKRVRVGVGGQLIRVCPQAYTGKGFLDHVAVGDAEATLDKILRGARMATGYVRPAQYATPDYANYWALDERLDEMSTYHLGPFTKIRQLVVESVRGCAWAYATQTCDMCSLEGVELKPMFRELPAHFALEKHLQNQCEATWLFDVSNQWLPTLKPTAMVAWLKHYCEQREMVFGQAGGPNKYVYLTANSLTPETAPLLRRAGIRIAYIGFDGWDKPTLQALHKSQPSIRRVLQLCRENDLHVRSSLVIGSGVNSQNINELPDFVRSIIGEYGDIIRSWGNFIQIVLPGSPVFGRFKQQAGQNGWSEVSDLYRKFDEAGYLTWAEQSRLNELFVRYTQAVDYEVLIAARDQAEKIVSESPYTTGVTIEHGGVLK